METLILDTLDFNKNRIALDELYIVVQAGLVIVGCIINFFTSKRKR